MQTLLDLFRFPMLTRVQTLRKSINIKSVAILNSKKRYLVTVPNEYLTQEIHVRLQEHMVRAGVNAVVVPEQMKFYVLPEHGAIWDRLYMPLMVIWVSLFIADHLLHWVGR